MPIKSDKTKSSGRGPAEEVTTPVTTLVTTPGEAARDGAARLGAALPEGPRLPQALEHVPIDALRPYERNPRTHSPEQITKIAASLLEYGWTNPILVDGEAF